MDDSDGSLSSAGSEEIKKLAPIFKKAKAATKIRFPPPVVSPPRPKRAPSPPHETVLADNPDIAFIVMFRSRFNEVMPGKLAQMGPQDVERGVEEDVPSPQIEGLLCAILGLVLNRKKPVERGHHGRALEEAILSNRAQWPHSWLGVNPLHGNRDFTTMAAPERLNLLRTLIMFSLTTSEAISTLIKEKYKQVRHSDDENQPLSVQPWGLDGDKRRYFLIQGLDDTSFRVYREGSRYTKNAHWYSMAGEIDELRALAKKLEDVDGTQAARRLAGRIAAAIPVFEGSEEKRKRREYRQVKRAAFTRPSHPQLDYHRGWARQTRSSGAAVGTAKRVRYFSDEDDEDAGSDATSTRRSARMSGRNTPAEAQPTFTSSGRVSRRPGQGMYGESLLRNATENESAREASGGRAGKRRRVDDEEEDDDDMSNMDTPLPESGEEWDSAANEDNDANIPDADSEDDAENDLEEDEPPASLVVKLKVHSSSPAAAVGGVEMNGVHGTPPPAISAYPTPASDSPKGVTNGVKAPPEAHHAAMTNGAM